MSEPVPGARGGLARAGVLLAVAMMAANVLGYVLVLALSRILAPATTARSARCSISP